MDWSEFKDWDEYTKLLIGLLALSDPISVIPVLGSLTAKFSPSEKKKTINISIITFIITLFVILYLGSYILSLFGITIAAFKIAGGIMFLFYSLDMLGLITISSSASDDSQVTDARSIGVSPIGIPLLAGPGAISSIIIYGALHASFTHKVLVMGVILSVAAIIYLIFRISLTLGSGMNETTATVMNKIMGLLLAAIAVEFILDGIAAHFPQLLIVH